MGKNIFFWAFPRCAPACTTAKKGGQLSFGYTLQIRCVKLCTIMAPLHKICVWSQIRKIKRKSLMRDSGVKNQFAFDFSDLRSNANFMQRGPGPMNHTTGLCGSLCTLKTPGSAVMTRERVHHVHWGQTLFPDQRWPGNQSSWQMNGVRLPDPAPGYNCVKLTDFRVIVDPEWSLAPMDPFPGHADPGVFRVYIVHKFTQLLHRLHNGFAVYIGDGKFWSRQAKRGGRGGGLWV